MRKRGFAFEFNVPDGWDDNSTTNQVVAHGPKGEELIISGTLVTGDGSRGGLAQVRDLLLKNAFEAVNNAAGLPELEVTKPLERESLSEVDGWTLYSRTKDRETLFAQAIVASEGAILIATMEGPNQEATLQAFQSFLSGVRRATTH